MQELDIAAHLRQGGTQVELARLMGISTSQLRTVITRWARHASPDTVASIVDARSDMGIKVPIAILMQHWVNLKSSEWWPKYPEIDAWVSSLPMRPPMG